MDWNSLKAKVSDDAEATSFIDSQIQKTGELTTQINNLEVKANDAISSRQQLKDLIKTVTGITEVSEEALKTLLDGKKSGGDESLLKEVENYKSMVEKLNLEKDTITKEYDGRFKDMALTNSLRDLGIGSLASSPIAEKMLIEELKKNATLDGDKIVYKNEDGTTIFNGSNVMTPIEKLNLIKSDENWSPFLKADITSGSDTQRSSGGDRGTPKTFKERQAAQFN
jgi:hypothetical protein